MTSSYPLCNLCCYQFATGAGLCLPCRQKSRLYAKCARQLRRAASAIPAASIPRLMSARQDVATRARSEHDRLTRVDARVFLGNLRAAEKAGLLRANNIRQVVSILHHPPATSTHFLLAEDDNAQDMRHVIHTCIRWLDVDDRNARSLVHCHASRSRSVTVVLAYLMLHHRLPLVQAYAYLSARHPWIDLSDGFAWQLQHLDRDLRCPHRGKWIIPLQNALHPSLAVSYRPAEVIWSYSDLSNVMPWHKLMQLEELIQDHECATLVTTLLDIFCRHATPSPAEIVYAYVSYL